MERVETKQLASYHRLSAAYALCVELDKQGFQWKLEGRPIIVDREKWGRYGILVRGVDYADARKVFIEHERAKDAG